MKPMWFEPYPRGHGLETESAARVEESERLLERTFEELDTVVVQPVAEAALEVDETECEE